MAVALGRVLTPGLKFRYTYDFGASTELSLRVVGEIRVAPGKVLAPAKKDAIFAGIKGCHL
jgi:hypothetical protein